MVSVKRLAIEYPIMPCHTSIPIATPAQTSTSTSEHIPEREPPFSNLRKRICGLFKRIFENQRANALKEKNKTLEERNKTVEKQNKSLEEKNQTLEKEVIVLKVRLEEASRHENTAKKWLENEVNRGIINLQTMLQSQTSEVHETRMFELEAVRAIFQRHEEVALGCQRLKQAYEELVEEFDQAQQEIGTLTQRNRDLVRERNELERCVAQGGNMVDLRGQAYL